MRRFLITTVLALIGLLLMGAPSMAESLDDYLQPYCGVDYQPPVDHILAQYHDEILRRATGFMLLEDTPTNSILFWYLGALQTPEARDLGLRVVTTGPGSFQRMVMGAVSNRPDWGGLELVLAGAGVAEEMTRDSAASILGDVDYSRHELQTPNAAAHRQQILAGLDRLIPTESNARIRALLEGARTRLASATLPASGS